MKTDRIATDVLCRPRVAAAAIVAIGAFCLSARGDRFAVRFEAFGGDEDERGMRGENALRGRQAGDNAAAQASHLMKVWLGSSGHRRNLMAYDYRYVSTGVVQKGATFYAVQMFWQR
jgi:uncharacterized protein YkwD